MKIMKKILCVFLAIISVSTVLSSCEKIVSDESEKINVLGTVFPPFDFAREIGADNVTAEMLMAPGTDSHSYSGDNPSDILKIANCDLFIYIGGESESSWVDKVLETIEKSTGKTPETLNLSLYCDLLEESDEGIIENSHSGISYEKHGHNHEDSHHEHDECSFDEHIWTSLSNAEKIAEAICLKLCEMDPKNSDVYKENFESYKAKLNVLDGNFAKIFENVQKPLVFADRFPFAYFKESYSLDALAAFGGCATENEPSPTTLASLVKIISDEEIKSIFYIETSKSTVPNALSKATGADTYLIHSCHTVTEKQLSEGVSYLSLMENNFENFRKALSND